jgi:carbonic anhydrase/acetyltransferase-like protein (isoleucine patch superfamily)
MALFQLDDRVPQVHPGAYVADSAELIGTVIVEEGASVWSNVVARGDNEPITIGRGANVQEGTVLHTDMGYPLTIGADATVGHQAMLHGCTVGEGALIGIQAVVLNGAVIGPRCLVGAGALVTEGKVFAEEGMLILGSPAKAVRPVKPEDLQRIQRGAEGYAARGAHYKTALKRVG